MCFGIYVRERKRQRDVERKTYVYKDKKIILVKYTGHSCSLLKKKIIKSSDCHKSYYLLKAQHLYVYITSKIDYIWITEIIRF